MKHLRKKVIVCRFGAGSFAVEGSRRCALRFPARKSGGGAAHRAGRGQQNIFLAWAGSAGLAVSAQLSRRAPVNKIVWAGELRAGGSASVGLPIDQEMGREQIPCVTWLCLHWILWTDPISLGNMCAASAEPLLATSAAWRCRTPGEKGFLTLPSDGSAPWDWHFSAGW